MSVKLDIAGGARATRTDIPSWPNEHTGLTTIMSVTHVIFERTVASLQTKLLFSSPFRLYGLVRAAQDDSPFRVVLHVAAFGALFTPYSHLAALGIDIFGECVNACTTCLAEPEPEEGKRLAPLAVARALLNLSLDETLNDLQLQTNYLSIISQLNTQKGYFAVNSTQRQEIQQKITEVGTAYTNLDTAVHGTSRAARGLPQFPTSLPSHF